jgi:hypothetical protein
VVVVVAAAVVSDSSFSPLSSPSFDSSLSSESLSTAARLVLSPESEEWTKGQFYETIGTTRNKKKKKKNEKKKSTRY